MKHIKLASAIAFVMGAAVSASSFAAPAGSGGTITFTGQINDTTCTVTGGTGTNEGTGNFIVALDPADANQLATVGATANQKQFDVIFSGPNCASGKTAYMSYMLSSPQIDAGTGALKNALSGEATNVQIQLADSSKTAINLANPGQSWSTLIGATTANTGKLSFFAQYLAVNGPATPGKVSTSVVYSVVYN
ncbi:fimbrial protein [Dyella silvae]|uniref:fimbrial protein n=1 Tax=Dyella silvae TaxID=2994424 RepID=UPI0022649127|nr:fimbrial protein [Dyella silvae]